MTMTTDDMVFIFCSNVVFIPWLALMIVPKWKWTSPITKAVVLILCVVYTIYFASPMRNSKEGVLAMYMDMGTLDGIAKLFRGDGILLPAWVHYLAFDLVVGHYLVQKNMEDPNGLSKLAMAPCLFLNIMAGPTGMLLYVVLRAASDCISGRCCSKGPEKTS
ncbi:unnamed protein product [Ectocarpus sp. 12 AP-2014]